jgi:hypothetical protein
MMARPGRERAAKIFLDRSAAHAVGMADKDPEISSLVGEQSTTPT